MGRKRQSNHDDPPRFHRKGKTWYHVALVDGKRKWTKLSTDRAESLRMWAQVEGVRADDSTKLFSVIVQRYQREVYIVSLPYRDARKTTSWSIESAATMGAIAS